jgi:hypothetical protein
MVVGKIRGRNSTTTLTVHNTAGPYAVYPDIDTQPTTAIVIGFPAKSPPYPTTTHISKCEPNHEVDLLVRLLAICRISDSHVVATFQDRTGAG